MLEIEFATGAAPYRFMIEVATPSGIDAARDYAEMFLDDPLPLDPCTNFPNYILYRDGVEIAQG
jgi:hypothetical protein